MKPPKIYETTFATYNTVKGLGQGGSGEVFEVSDGQGGTFALKALSKGASTEKLKRFKNEVAFCERRIPGIVEVVDRGVSIVDGKRLPFYVMPRYAGSLRDWLKRGPLEPTRALSLFGQLLDALEAAHRANVWHRDLKPENLLMSEDGATLVVADFGVAHFAEDLLATTIETKPETRLANFQYAAPEQREKGKPVDSRSDIYALGLILNEMFTGVVPQGKDHPTIGQSASRFAYLDPIVDRLMAHSPAGRPAKVSDLRFDLENASKEFAAEEAVKAARAVLPPTVPTDEVPDFSIVGHDWRDGVLHLTLDGAPPQGWLDAFRNPGGSYSTVMGAELERFQLKGRVLSVPAEPHIVQGVYRLVPGYISNAGRALREARQAAAERQALLKRREIEKRQQEEQKRLDVLRGLNASFGPKAS